MVRSLALSAGPFDGTPARIGYRPVNTADRDGAQTGAAAYQFVKRAPDWASASILGVFRSVAPHAPMSWQPKSSARKIMKFGLRPGAAATGVTVLNAAVDRSCLRDSM